MFGKKLFFFVEKSRKNDLTEPIYEWFENKMISIIENDMSEEN